MTRPFSEWVKVVAYQIQDGALTFAGICEALEAAPTVKSGEQLPDLPPGEYKLVLWKEHA